MWSYLVIPKKIDDVKVTIINFEHNEDTCKSFKTDTVVIPNSVTTIEAWVFRNSGIKNLSFEENSSLTTINLRAFSDNQIESVEIPDSVITIGEYAFSTNNLKIVTIGNGIKYIYNNVFKKSSISNPNLESITFVGKTCDEIKNIQGASSDTNKYFPWLYDSSPYYLEGYEAKIIGTDGECSY